MKQKLLVRLAAMGCALVIPARVYPANVTVNAANELAVVSPEAFGIHTSVYDNQNLNPALPGLLEEAGITALRYSGGGYADVYHWSVHKLTPWFGGNGYGYLGPGTDFGQFVQLISNANSRAVITINYGSSQKWNGAHTRLISSTGGQPQEAAAWVAYANADAALYGTTNDFALGIDADGNDWRTAGFWAKLRSSTPAEYQSWAGTNYSADFNFLAIHRSAPAGITYWEIGNETFGDGYYNQSPTNNTGFDPAYSENLFAPYGIDRRGQTNLSPAFYGQKVNQFAAAMKAVDPTIKIGTVLTTPPGDYNWDYYQRFNVNYPYNQINGPNAAGVKHWNPEVLAQCASNTDFVIAHWYPYAGNNADGTALLSAVRTTLPPMINGTTPGLDTGANAGLRDWIHSYRPADGTNVEIFITEFGYNGAVTNSLVGPVNALFAADSYATWLDLGVANVDYLEMNKTPFLGDGTTLVRGAVFYAMQMLRRMAGVGDRLIGAVSDSNNLRAHAALRQDGGLGLLLINEDPNNSQNVNVIVTNSFPADSGMQYEFGIGNFVSGNETPVSGPSTNPVSGLGNSFSVSVPAYTMVVLTVPLQNTAPILAAISDRNVNVGQTVAFNASATDADLPPQTLTYALINTLTNGQSVPPPANATLDPASGAFSWRPLVTQAGTTNPFSLTVTDSGTPAMSSTQRFTVVVAPLSPTVLGSTWTNGQLQLTLFGSEGPDYAVQASTNLVHWDTILTTNSPSMPFIWTDPVSVTLPLRFYRIVVGPPFP